LTISGKVPVESIGTVLTPGTGSLSITGYAPQRNVNYVPDPARLAITGIAPTVFVSEVLSPEGEAIMVEYALQSTAIFFTLVSSQESAAQTSLLAAPNVTSAQMNQ
jgi:hypothetical protein